jgi:long-chain acyl-CoA synthetase
LKRIADFKFASTQILTSGLTETCAGSFLSIPDEVAQCGTVGPPLCNVEARLESVPEMHYDALGTPARGEVCIRAKTVFAGYYKRDDLTKEAIVDGWFHTGWFS